MNFFQGLKQQLGFIVELFIISTALSYLIKYGGPYLSISATWNNALIIVVLPTLVMAIALMARYWLSAKKL